MLTVDYTFQLTAKVINFTLDRLHKLIKLNLTTYQQT